MEINFLKENFGIILKYVKELCPNIKNPKYSPAYYLTNIMDILRDFVSWRSLTKSNNCINNKKNHYKCIARMHRLWCSKKVYLRAYQEIVMTDANFIINDDGTLEILLDATNIINKCGVNGIGFGGASRKKKKRN